MRRTEQAQGLRLLKFEEVYGRICGGVLSRAEARAEEPADAMTGARTAPFGVLNALRLDLARERGLPTFVRVQQWSSANCPQ